jgi:hypothetical protein
MGQEAASNVEAFKFLQVFISADRPELQDLVNTVSVPVVSVS